MVPFPLLAALAPLAAQGNVLVAADQAILEVTPSGALVATLPVPYPGVPAGQKLHDVVVHPSGDLYVFNGTSAPYLSVRRAATGAWEHATAPGFDTFEGSGFGGVAVIGGYAFLADSKPVTKSLGSGLFRVDLATLGFELFAETFSGGFTDVTAGHDGRVYGLKVGGTVVAVYEPESLALAAIVTLERQVRGVAAAQDGTLFGAGWDGSLLRFAPDGALEAELATGAAHLTDVDLDACGSLVAGTEAGWIVLSDAALSTLAGAFVGEALQVSFADPAQGLHPALEVVRAGTPPNPIALASLEGAPVLGQPWTAQVAPFLPGATLDVVWLSGTALEATTPWGTLLAPPDLVLAGPAGAPFPLQVPAACELAGLALYAQAASTDGVALALANGLDLALGTFPGGP